MPQRPPQLRPPRPPLPPQPRRRPQPTVERAVEPVHTDTAPAFLDADASPRRETALFRTVLVRPHERGLRFRDGHFIAVVPPGQYTVFTPPWDEQLETLDVVDTLRVRLDHPQLDALLADGELRTHLLVLDVPDHRHARITVAGQPHTTVGPGRHAFWRLAGEDPVDFEWLDDAPSPSRRLFS